MQTEYRIADTVNGAREPKRPATRPHRASKMNIPRPNIARVKPISLGVALSWASLRGTEIRMTPVAIDSMKSATMRAALRLRSRDSVGGPAATDSRIDHLVWGGWNAPK